ncbi:MAG: glycoside hydrolase family 97 N-terminal domain-containing protein, partial [Woeseiaceae bacterium]
MTRTTTILTLIFAAFALPGSLWSAELRSPDGDIAFTVDVDGKGTPRYSVTYRGETVIEDSRLGMRFEEQHGFDSGLRISATREDESDTAWEQPWGERRSVVDRHHELLVGFESRERPKQRFD